MTTVATCHQPYAIGAGGIGVSAIIRYWRSKSVSVQGTDLNPSSVTDALQALGTTLTLGETPQSLPPGTDYLLFSEAAPPDHPLRLDAVAKGIPARVYAQALAELMEPFAERVVVTGTNGKSSTTAFLGWLLTSAKRNPSVVVGSLVPQLGGNYRAGEKLVVAEGDEYREHVLALSPTRLLITNVAFDHPDAFPDLVAVHATFQKAVAKLPPTGTLYLNADDPELQSYSARHAHVVRFSTTNTTATVCLQRIDAQTSQLTIEGKSIGRVRLPMPGANQRSNAAAAALVAFDLGVTPQDILTGLESFKGLWRRFELLGDFHGSPLITDYAHHPDGVVGAIQAARERFPGKSIVTVFQPHHEARLRALTNEFAQALSLSDQIVLVPVYTVAGREHATASSFPIFHESLEQRAPGRVTLMTLEDIPKKLATFANEQSVIVAMSAGSLDSVVRQLV